MIYTVTFNPSLDYIIKAENFALGKTNRSVFDKIQFGGKGINVSIILSRLGIENTALGFIAGFTGDALRTATESEGIKTDFVKLKNGNTRINIKLKTDTETEINAAGPDISPEALSGLFQKLGKLKNGDTLILSGSIPKNIPEDIYEKIFYFLSDKNIRFVVDASGKLLLNTLKYKPFLIKPNLAELEEISGKELKNRKDIITAAKQLKNKGAVNVLVSLGKDGAVLIDGNGKIHTVASLCKEPVNTTGAGDSMVAGFIAGINKGYDYALSLANAAAGATASSLTLAEKKDIIDLIG